MTDDDALAARLAAVERALTSGQSGPDGIDGIQDAAAVDRRLSTLESTVEDLTDRVTELEAATQAVRGYLGGVRAVNRGVERRADAALAKAETLEAALVDEPDLAVERVPVTAGETSDHRDDRSPIPTDAGDVASDGDGARLDGVPGGDDVPTRDDSVSERTDDTFVDRLRDAL